MTQSNAIDTRNPDDASIPLLTEKLAVPPTLPPLDFDVTLPPIALTLNVDLPMRQEQTAGESTRPRLDLSTTLMDTQGAESVAPESLGAVPESVTPPTEYSTDEESHWAQLERELNASVVQNLARRLPQTLDKTVRRHVALATDSAIREFIDPLVARLTADTQIALNAAIREMVKEAVQQELAQWRRAQPY